MDKTVVVTGASRGLGFSITTTLLSSGYNVVATSRKCSPELDSLISKNKDLLSFLPCDLSIKDAIHPFANEVVKKHGRIYGLVNNAAIGQDGILATMHEKDISTLLTVNLESTILLTKYLLRPMLLNQSGRIINVSSIIANTGFNGLSVYAATKAGLVGFSKSLAREVGKAGITVNCVLPGYMETEMTSGIKKDDLEKIKKRSPLGRLAHAEEVSSAVSYLLSDNAAAITGSSITVDCGSTA